MPPVLVAFTVNMVRSSNSVAVPLMTPVDVSNTRPDGKSGLTVHETMVPEPVIVGESGRSALAVFFVKFRSSGV